MRNSSRRILRPEALLIAALLLTGAGCDLGSKVSFQFPFKLETPPAADPSIASRALGIKAGARLALRPTYLGVTGSLDQLLGAAGKRDVTLTAFAPGATAKLDWSEDAKKGAVEATGIADARAMLLPSFWKEGDASVSGNGLLWMSPAAFSELESASTTEWRLGVAESALAPLSKALQTFDAVSAALFKTSATSTAAAALRGPFMIEKKGKGTFPLLVDGGIQNLGVIQASGWFADYVILDDPNDPLILKVNVNPLAAQALKSFADAGVDPKTIGYEIVSIDRK